MNFLSPELDKYVAEHTEPESETLQKLNRETNAKVLYPQMLAGHLQGRMLSMLCHMIQPKQILEIGTYTGYSAICLAEGLQEGGTFHTIDINEELEEMVKSYFVEAGISDKVRFYIGNALEIIPTIDKTFDLVFIDADKENYINYYNMVFDKVRTGGYIIADNVLWNSKVLQDAKKMDAETRAINAFNKKIQADLRVHNVLFPIRDGLMLIRKS
ncbi:MAG: methyltransferase [Flavobacteriales bacterium]|nr:MAG: methyltransferase [Flavobacteriales bacterium]